MSESPVTGSLLMYRLPDKVILLSYLTFPAMAWSVVDFPLPLGLT